MDRDEFRSLIDLKRLTSYAIDQEVHPSCDIVTKAMFQAHSRQGLTIDIEGRDWLEVYRKVPDWLKLEG